MIVVMPASLAIGGAAHAHLVRAGVPKITQVNSTKQLRAILARHRAVVFADTSILPELGPIDAPVIAILDCKDGEALQASVRLLAAHPWLSHVITVSMLTAPHASQYVATLLERLTSNITRDMLAGGKGRVALLASASRRNARFDRIREFFSNLSLSERTIGSILEVSEELVMNALYDAPAEAGYFQRPRERVEDVNLPAELACEISYGIENDIVFVRLRDPFGALSRERLFEVLARCTTGQHDVTLDESRGGAGLGLWRVFSIASTVAITVVPGSLTDVLVGIRIKDGRGARKQLQAIHLFFANKSEYYESLAIIPGDDHALLDQSITLILVA